MSKGVLLINLGSPDSTETGDVRRYLREFLSDPRVLDINPIQRSALVNLIIAPTRAPKSAEAYKEVWTEQGSPLIATTYRVRDLLRERIDLPVEVGMRYGNPSAESGIRALMARGVTELFLIPLYPHYAMSSYETAVAKVQDTMDAIAPKMRLVVQPPFYNDPQYIDAVLDRASEALAKNPDHVLFSFHGIPERQVKATDPSGCYCLRMEKCCEMSHPAHSFCYRHQCFTTAKMLAERAGLEREQWSVSFQSRLGRDPWLKPYTDFVLEELPSKGVKSIAVFSPAFVADCLETIEELGMEGKEDFLKAGGKAYDLVPCLNDSTLWIDLLERFVTDYLAGTLAV
ncbi:ferrochelatase [Bradymonadaceae bacterium TMQ3]|uniref:Ferrochelatase n=1 Tax=Lujinxingia sediminis TaxID=2480984 RepID=A0ABY0CWT1_9DELT|nr:ferrochelatase [Lujinxingia sediminis]RDV39611.1 ferrochelatase [Bradymonadaceae bacterium TMQ3]RVU48341.1 ferrochelatase [Lujinxingia sediminis]TXC77643.1 ferrochelatase [Bradymonadales bacterium TMQ1]